MRMMFVIIWWWAALQKIHTLINNSSKEKQSMILWSLADRRFLQMFENFCKLCMFIREWWWVWCFWSVNVPFFKKEKKGLLALKLKNGLQKPRNTPTVNGGLDIWFMRFFQACYVYQANFERSHISYCFGAVFPLYGPTNENGWQIFVSRSINLRVFSGHSGGWGGGIRSQ